jgi:hypothetical protein
MAGQGGKEADYYYLTQEARSWDLTDPEVRRETAVSSQELTEWIKQIPALKQTPRAGHMRSGEAGGEADKDDKPRHIPVGAGP